MILAPPSLEADVQSTLKVAAEIEADGNIVRQLRDLECELSLMLTKLRKLLADCDVSDAQFFFILFDKHCSHHPSQDKQQLSLMGIH